jgi:hypothetical protein
VPPTDPPHLEHLTEDERKVRAYINAMKGWGTSEIFLDVALDTIAALRASEHDLTERVKGLERTLRTIETWDAAAFPKVWDQFANRHIPYGEAHGLIGERNFMRNLARAALAAQAKETT